jgi:hypothetical protein
MCAGDGIIGRRLTLGHHIQAGGSAMLGQPGSQRTDLGWVVLRECWGTIWSPEMIQALGPVTSGDCGAPR